jgi:putative Mg2+ transporter-C (MgtC) family protein
VLIAHIRRDILHYPPDRANVYSWKTVAEKMMSVQAQLEALIPVAVAMVLSGLIGLNREWRRSPAGIRTHMLVSMGSALVMVLGAELYDKNSAARLAANVITGIGFLGAGVIIHRNSEVHELTTAASLWFVAILGLVAGAKLYVLAVGSTLLGWMVLGVLRWLTKRPDRGGADPAQGETS